ncbi:helix-turn-helix transcriptional regulator [Desulfosporosinus sp. OT]|uniref:helix-turn-helix transcriptional regulator n=1 Tax=Desulfosporosinus sp. OT TaxID=913865 RepID=UPI0002239F8A|nr:helix-turn-helix transcriptional regulator [Desulfosporosinus sp. OT]EGW40689.1 helix-turn-helix family protein [Desulfosporosinus sp. OT]
MAGKTGRRLRHYPYLKLKALLAEKNLKQKYLADLLGLSPVTINQKINGTLEFTYTEAEIICDELEVSTEILRGQKVS